MSTLYSRAEQYETKGKSGLVGKEQVPAFSVVPVSVIIRQM